MSVFAYERQYRLGDAALTVSGSDEQISLADVYRLKITVTSPQTFDAEITYEPDDADFDLVEQPGQSGSRVKGEMIVKTYSIGFAPLSAGEAVLEGITVKITGSDNELELEPIQVSVVSALTQEDIELIKTEGVDPLIDESLQVRDVAAIPFDKRIIAAAAAGGIILAAAIVYLLIRWKRRRDRRIRYVSLNYTINSAVVRLNRLDLPSRGKYELYYQTVCNLLRYYIEYRFNLRARDMTTEEFLESLRDSSDLDTATKGDLKYFMEQCDMVKFARYVPDEEQIRYIGSLLEEFANKTADAERQITEAQARIFDEVVEEAA
ncbi:hypothetical protein SMSP2_02561 [Limihaloglobus sulfuriphilus]|uniref:Protein BatD n=2 Tax=Limihaloglobus sulfuriphilus TaxID=1851148 RepID=A0A1Q2MHL6_9BACT|nr:hypothetical protein SMSP2_02561 [Limihaloglobus sulfuriphilus]